LWLQSLSFGKAKPKCYQGCRDFLSRWTAAQRGGP
jgi:hypothetical protein